MGSEVRAAVRPRRAERVAEPILITPYPRERVFCWPELEAAVRHAFSHPLLPAARRDTERLTGARLTDAFWTLREWALVFDNGTELRIWPEEPEVRWRLAARGDNPVGEGVSRVGAPPVSIRWLQSERVAEMDCSDLVAKRLGAHFRDLFVNDLGLFVYFREPLILCFDAVRCETDGRSMLYVYEDD
jgi:hypothetical protein